MTVVKAGAIGPHEGHELELMLAGSKPLSVFVTENSDKAAPVEFPEDAFSHQVAAGVLRKQERLKTAQTPSGNDVEIRTVYYSLPAEEWRIHAFMFLEDLYKELGGAYRPDLERFTGRLLGYEPADIEFFIQTLREKGSRLAYV